MSLTNKEVCELALQFIDDKGYEPFEAIPYGMVNVFMAEFAILYSASQHEKTDEGFSEPIVFKADIDLGFKDSQFGENINGIKYIGNSRIDGKKMYMVDKKKFIEKYHAEREMPANADDLTIQQVAQILKGPLYPISTNQPQIINA